MLLSLDQIKDITRGCARIEEQDQTFVLMRFTEKQAQAYRDIGNEDFYNKTFATAGVRLAFRTDSSKIAFDYRFTRCSSRQFAYFDVYLDGALTGHFGTQGLECMTGHIELPIPAATEKVEIHFPWSHGVRLSHVEIDDNSTVTGLHRPHTMICFGDSITHGYDAEMTSQSYASIVMRRLDLDGMNQGVGGYTFHHESLDPALFEGRTQPDIITIAYGTNDWSGKTNENFTRDIDEYFVRLRELYPDVPVLVITPVFRASHYIPTKAGTFEYAREYLANAAKKHPNTYVLDGDKLVPHLYDCFRDVRLHPNDAGFVTYGASVADAVAEILGIRPKSFFI